jgi:hypothetical protein
MSMTPNEVAYDSYMAELYEEHKKEAIEEFTAERLQSYFIDNKLLAESATNALSEARNLLHLNATAGFIFGAIAMEVGLKTTLLKPIVHGLVHAESVAALITELTISQPSMGRYSKLLFQILEKHGGIDLNSYKRVGFKETLWEEINEVQRKRNSIMHRAETVSKEGAELAIGVASEILEKLFPTVIAKIGLHLHDGFRICNDWKCNYENI